jgi:hypothetical protein
MKSGFMQWLTIWGMKKYRGTEILGESWNIREPLRIVFPAIET